MQVDPSYVAFSAFLLASYSFFGLLLLIKKGWILGVKFLIFTFGAFWGNILFHLLPETFLKLPLNAVLTGLLLGWSVSWGIEKSIGRQHKGSLSGIAYHLLGNDLLHNFLDGFMVLLSFGGGPMAGLSTTLAVILHELPQELCEWGVMLKAGFSPQKVVILNFIASLTAPLGLGLGYLFFQSFQEWTPYLIPVAAGNFLYIANFKLLPLLLRELTPIFCLSNVLIFFSGFLLIAGSLLFQLHAH